MAEPINPRAEIIKKEMARRANDTIKVHNPTNEVFPTYWDGFLFNVPPKNQNLGYGNGNQILPRYIALNYVKHMADKILTEQADTYINAINEKRKKRGQPALNPQEREIEETPYRTDNEERRAPIIRQLWLGVEREYGLEEKPRPIKEQDRRPLEERIIDEIEQRATIEEKKEEIPEIEAIKEAQIEEVAQ